VKVTSKKVIAVICDDIDGVCTLATRDNFVDKHIMIRERVAAHKFPTKNLRGEVVEGEGYGWTDMQTVVLLDLSKKNLRNFLKLGYKIPKELLESKMTARR
jgi:hypothetical protein